ncbi:1,6-anhydro-N-acetylmuramyl-L-alanine amidase [hydrothermal vent metagenome]|uniref:1,6-anhydro-N-acetylmuramyl-L-alanine amidase AmpD n=1 Tax=hydrothermal vent metagenome TaxID=652676 RepID=A0A3B0WFV7_9ZZZZ
MKINKTTGTLNDCKQCPSPNKDTRPKNTTIDLIVIHSISLPPEQYGNHFIEDFFQNKLDKNQHPYFKEIFEMQVSSHVLIKRTGEIVQFVPFLERAWHAGQSNYKGREHCNDFSIGIELEGTDSDIFEDEQYQQLEKLIRALQITYPAISDNITGHSDISPGRKKDPGTGFNWHRLKKNLIVV